MDKVQQVQRFDGAQGNSEEDSVLLEVGKYAALFRDLGAVQRRVAGGDVSPAKSGSGYCWQQPSKSRWLWICHFRTLYFGAAGYEVLRTAKSIHSY